MCAQKTHFYLLELHTIDTVPKRYALADSLLSLEQNKEIGQCSIWSLRAFASRGGVRHYTSQMFLPNQQHVSHSNVQLWKDKKAV